MRYILFLLLLTSSLYAQIFVTHIPAPELTASDVDLGTIVQSATPDTNLIELSINARRLTLDSVSSSDSSSLYFPSLTQELADSNRAYTLGTIGDWVVTGEQDSLLTTKPDSVFQYNNIPTELNPNPNFDFSYTNLTSGVLVTNSVYEIVTYVAGDDFSNLSATNVTGNIFKASGTTPTTWTNGSTLRKLIPPTGWTASTMGASNYVIEDAEGAKIVSNGTAVSMYYTFPTVIGQTYYAIVDVDIITAGYGYFFGASAGYAYHGSTVDGKDTLSYTATTTTGELLFIRYFGTSSEFIVKSANVTEYHPTNNVSLGINGLVENQYYKATVGYEEGETNLHDDASSTFESGTYNWAVYGTNTISNVNNELKITYVDHASGAYLYFRDSYTLTENLIIGDYYGFAFDAYVNGGSSVQFGAATLGNGSSFETITSTTKQRYVVYFQADATTSNFARCNSMGSGEILYVDNLKLYHLDSESQKVEQGIPSFTWDNQTYTLNALSSTREDSTFSLKGKVENDYVSFDGVNDKVLVSSFTETFTDFSLLAYVNIQGHSVSYQDIVALNSGGSTSIQMRLRANDSYLFPYIASSNGTAEDDMQVDVLDLDEWVLISLIKSGNTVYIYSDTTLISSSSETGWNDFTPSNFSVGYRPNERYTNGLIKTVKFYNRGITDSELLVLYNERNSTSNTTITDSLKLDLNGIDGNISKTTWTDASGNGNDGAISGATWVVEPRLEITVDDTCKFKLDFSLEKIPNSVIVTSQNNKTATYITDNSTVGSKSETMTFNHTGSNNGNTVTVNWKVIPEIALAFLPSNDTLYVGNDTIRGYTTDSIWAINSSETDIFSNGYNSFSNSNFGWVLGGQPTSFLAGDTSYFILSYDPTHDTSFVMSYNLLYRYTDLEGTEIDTFKTMYLKVVTTGFGSSGGSEITDSVVLATSTTTGEIGLTWDGVNNANGYRVYRGGELIGITTSTTYSDIINPFYSESYYVVAYNNTSTKTSNTINRTMLPIGNQGQEYFLISNTQGSVNFTTIAQVNSQGAENKEFYFYATDQFDDAILNPKQGQTFGSYGGSGKATIGDSTKTGHNIAEHNGVIDIRNENVTLRNLKVLAYTDAYFGIVITEDAFTITGCEILGSYYSHDLSARAIVTEIAGLNKQSYITHNTIKNWNRGIALTNPYNIDISYNTVSYMYVWDGYQDVGGGCIAFGVSGSNDSWQANYTVNIHHNDFSKYEHTALWVGACSGIIAEYNLIHDNLDCRLYFGGVKHGGVGKFFDETGQTIGSIGNIFRYNYVYNTQREGDAGTTYDRPTKAQIIAGQIQVASTGGSSDLPIFNNAKNTPSNLYSEPYEGFADGGISGLGWANHYIHNNVFYNMGHKMYSVGYNREIMYFYNTSSNKPSAGAVYTTSGTNYTVISTSSSYILVKKSGGDIEYPSNSGTLTKVSGTGETTYNYTSLRIAGDVIGSPRKFRTDYPKWLVNNTSFRIGKYSTTTGDKGIVGLEFDSQSPTHIYNNIMDIRSTDHKSAMYINEGQTYIDGNIFPTRSGEHYTPPGDMSAPSSGTNYAIWYRSLYENDYDESINWATDPTNYFYTRPEFADTLNTRFVANLGPSGVYMYDFRLLDYSNAYNSGVDYSTIHGGVDGEGRSFAYDIEGNLRTVPTIGAFGLKSNEYTSGTLDIEITVQPSSVVIYENGTASFTTVATSNNTGAVGYNWWRYPYVDKATSLVVDGGKFSGATTGTLTITNVTSDELLGIEGFLCEAYNLSDTTVHENSNVVTITLLSGGGASADIDTLTINSSTDDAVVQYNTQFQNWSYLRLGTDGSPASAGLRFTGVDNFVQDDSTFIYLIANSGSAVLDLNIYGEYVESPLTFSTATDFNTRKTNLTTAMVNYTSSGSWSTDDTIKINITSIVQELNANFTYSSGTLVIFILNNASSGLRSIGSFDDSRSAYIIRYGTK